jgi:hypothetical protein
MAYFCALRASRRTADQPGTIKTLAGLANTSAAQGRKCWSASLHKLAINQILDAGISNVNVGVLIKVVAGRISTSESGCSSCTRKRPVGTYYPEGGKCSGIY